MFDGLRIENEEVRSWFVNVLRGRTEDEQRVARDQAAELHRQLSLIRQQQDRLLNLRLLDEIDSDTFARNATELRHREAGLKVQSRRATWGVTRTPT